MPVQSRLSSPAKAKLLSKLESKERQALLLYSTHVMQVYGIEMLMGFEPSCNTPCHNPNGYLQDYGRALSAAEHDARFSTHTTCVADS
jgi:hypothetical protein